MMITKLCQNTNRPRQYNIPPCVSYLPHGSQGGARVPPSHVPSWAAVVCLVCFVFFYFVSRFCIFLLSMCHLSLQHVVFCILPPPYHVCRACVHHFLYQMCAFCTRIASLCPGSRDLHHHATLPTIFWLAHLFCVCLFPSLLPHSFTWVQLQWISMSQPMFSGAGCLVSYPPTMCIITCAPFPGVQYPVFWLWAEILWLSCILSLPGSPAAEAPEEVAQCATVFKHNQQCPSMAVNMACLGLFAVISSDSLSYLVSQIKFWI